MEETYLALSLGLGAVGLFLTWFALKGRARQLSDIYDVPVARVEKLFVYPFKSCHRIELQSSSCTRRGLKYDRVFVVCDKNGHFLSQRIHPKMATVRQRFVYGQDDEVSFALSAPGMEEVVVHLPPDDVEATQKVKMWDITGSGVLVGGDVGAWFSRFLGVECQVIYMSPKHKGRAVHSDPIFGHLARLDNEASFNDFSPLLLASEASMNQLNARMSEEMGIESFRPNIVLSGCLPHGEDEWPEVCIDGAVILNKVKLCERCKVTTIDQEKGEFSSGDPLATIKKYRMHSMLYDDEETSRKYGRSPLFGCNYGVIKEGVVRVNDVVCIEHL